MSNKFNLRTKYDHEYVDIHGRDIPAVIIEKTGEVAFPLTELKQTGFEILKKTQYAKLSTISAQFDEDFNLHMLESAKKYMLENKIAFPQTQILNTIMSCKKQLTQKQHPVPTRNFFKDRYVEELSDNEILIKVDVSSSSNLACTPTSGTIRKISTPKFPNKSPVFKNSDKLLNSHAAVHLNTTPQRNHNKSQDNHQNHVSSSQSKVNKRPARSQVLEKFPLEEREKEHNVIVTCIHKRNCIWVRDKANEDLFDKIHVMVNQEANHQKPVQKPWQMEKVYMAQDEGFWFRCKVMKFNPLTVFFLDYGNVAQADEVRDVSKELAQVPCMAVRLTFLESEYNPCLEDEITIKIKKQNEDTTYFVKVLKQTKKVNDSFPPPIFFKMPPPLTSLENGQTVVVIHVENGLFYLRTKECFLKLKEIEKRIENYIKSAQPLNSEIKINQLVLAPEDDKYYRALVTSIKSNKVDVKFLDYHKNITVDKDSVKNINEILSREPITYFQAAKLKNFENGDFGEEDQVMIQEIIKKRKKYAVVLDDQGSFDLFDHSVYLSHQLGQLKNCLQKINFQHMKSHKPEFCVKTYLCGFYQSSNEFSLVPSDELALYIDSVLIADIQDPEPYIPVAGEVCFCYYSDQWYRCLVSRVLNNDFEVILLDFGNVEIVNSKDIRKANDEIAKAPILGLPCKLINLPKHPNVEDLLKKLIIEGELYNVDVKSLNDGKYSVEIPSIYEEIMK